MPNTYEDQDHLDWINDVESSLYSDTVKEFVGFKIALVSGQAAYDFPTGYDILDIESVFVNGSEYKKRDLRQYQTSGYYKETDKLTLHPAPSQTDAVGAESLYVVCRYKPAAKTIDGIATDTLLLPDAFMDIYRYYIYAQICFLREQFDKGNNWLNMYNSRMKDYKIFYENNRPKQHIPYKKSW